MEHYRVIGDLSKSAIINRLTTVGDRAKTLDNKRTSFVTALNSLPIDRDPAAADRQLKELETRYDELREVEPTRGLYNQIKTRVDGRVNQAAAIERLRRNLQSRSLEDVLSAIQEATLLADKTGSSEFKDVAKELGIQEKVLEAEQLARRSLKEAVEALKTLENRLDIANEQHQQIGKRRVELESRLSRMAAQ